MNKLMFKAKGLLFDEYMWPDENQPGYAEPIAPPPEAANEQLEFAALQEMPTYIKLALSFVGRTEAKDISWIKGLFAYTSYPMKWVNNSTAWCAAFVCMLMSKSGLSNSRSAAAVGQAHLGEAMPLDQPYGICVWKHVSGSLKGHYHTNLALTAPLSLKPAHVKCVGGNQSDSCSVAYYGGSAYELYAYRKPV